MEHIPENNAEQGNRPVAMKLTSLGGMLREARERLGLSVADVAAQIKFAPRQIEALEAEDFKRLPEAAFLRGFVRSYAKILHLDAQTLLAALPQANAAAAEMTPASVEVPFPASHSSQRQNLILLGASLLLAVIVVVFSVWHFTNPLKQVKVEKIETAVSLPAEMPINPAQPAANQEAIATAIPDESKSISDEPKTRSSVAVEKFPVKVEKSQVTVEQSPVRTAKAAAAVQAVPKAQSIKAEDQSAKTEDQSVDRPDTPTINDTPAQITSLRLVFDEESWTEIKDRDGKIISSQVNPRGSELNLEGSMPIFLTIGHAATAHLYQDGEPVDLTPYINSSSEVARLTLE